MTKGLTVFLMTNELERLRAYYEHALGRKGEMMGPTWCQFEIGPGAVFALHATPSEERANEDRPEFSFDVEDIDATAARFLENGGVLVQGVQDESFGKSATVRDPGGKTVQLVEHG